MGKMSSHTGLKFIHKSYRRNCEMQNELKAEILKEIPEAQIEFVVGDDGREEKIFKTNTTISYTDAFDIMINGKLIFAKSQLGHYPDVAEIVEITKWGNKVGYTYPED